MNRDFYAGTSLRFGSVLPEPTYVSFGGDKIDGGGSGGTLIVVKKRPAIGSGECGQKAKSAAAAAAAGAETGEEELGPAESDDDESFRVEKVSLRQTTGNFLYALAWHYQSLVYFYFHLFSLCYL